MPVAAQPLEEPETPAPTVIRPVRVRGRAAAAAAAEAPRLSYGERMAAVVERLPPLLKVVE